MNVVVATAGHIDHGKSALLKALTGIDPDRLPEERRRGMTIDVGYAFLTLPDGSEIDFVDVPGHEDLLGNMIVGVAEADAALLVVAADEGPQAQTREHLEVLKALQIRHTVVAITKNDLPLAATARHRQAITSLVREIQNMVGRHVPVVTVSALTGQGIDGMRKALVGLQRAVMTDPRGRLTTTMTARLPIDRAFDIRGRGLVVTGTLRGTLRPGQEVRVVPSGQRVRIRELQIHGRGVDNATGGRTAANLKGNRRLEVRRGMVLAGGHTPVPTNDLLVSLRLNTDAKGLRGSFRLHLGTDQAMAKIRAVTWDAGTGVAVARLVLDRQIAAAAWDRFLARRPSPRTILGGGHVLDTQVPRRWASGDRAGVLSELVSANDPKQYLGALVRLHGAVPLERLALLAEMVGVSLPSDVLDRSGDIRLVGEVWLATELAERLQSGIQAIVVEAGLPPTGGLSRGAARRELVATLRREAELSLVDAAAVGDALLDELVRSGDLVPVNSWLLPAQLPPVGPELRAAMDRFIAAIDSPTPPVISDALRAARCPPEALHWLQRTGRIHRVSETLAFSAGAYRELATIALGLASTGPVKPAAFRDAGATTRRFALAILEDLDRLGTLTRTKEGHVLAG